MTAAFGSPARSVGLALLLVVGCGVTSQLQARQATTVGEGRRLDRPTVAVGSTTGNVHLDGVLDEPGWQTAELIDHLTMIEPLEGGQLQAETQVRILADAGSIVIGVEAEDPDPNGIVSFSKVRDPELQNEDHVKIVLDPFLDGRSGYVFAINPGGARYDALVANRGEGENAQWDAVWEAATQRSADGWSAEIRIPIQSLAFDGNLTRWGFNIERRVERLQEVSRWASPVRDVEITQTSRAGFVAQLPRFTTGLGLTVRPALVGGFEKPERTEPRSATHEPSLDVFQRLGSKVTLMGTANTDFAETEVDTRRTNLTRFSLFFPEKRTFFLEGSDIFDFGLGLTSQRPDVVPFFSRRIGLYEEEQVPLLAGAKVNGRIGETNLGGLVTRTDGVEGLIDAATMGAFRVQQNVLEESSAGIIATFGDPQGIGGSFLTGADFTLQTSRLGGDKNLLVGVWGMVTDRDGLTGDKTAFGGKIDYPNDTWDVALTYKRIGDGFDPSLGFVPRLGVQIANLGVNYVARPAWGLLRLMRYELRPSIVQSLDGRWESYRVFTAPVNWRFESGERFEFNAAPEGERLVEPFEIADGIVIPPGAYHWIRYRFEGDIAAKRPVSGRLSWWFGPFYDGRLHQIEVRLDLKPSQLATFEVSAVRNIGDLSVGEFTQELYGFRTQLNFSPDLQFTGFVQYDNDTRELGANSRVRWTFHPLGDLFVVYNHNVVRTDVDATRRRWMLDSNQLLVKVQYAFRY